MKIVVDDRPYWGEEELYYCPVCDYNKKNPGRCSTCGAQMIQGRPRDSKQNGVTGLHRREE